jgi:hypothetical protein
VMLTRKIHYVPYWVLAGAIFFGLEELAIRLFQETAVTWRQVLVASIGIFGVIIGWNSIYRTFLHSMSDLDSIVEIPGGDADSSIRTRAERFFTLKSWGAKVAIAILCIGATATMLLMGLPFRTFGMNALFLIQMQFFLAVCGHGVYFLIALLVFLSQVVDYPLKTSFYRVNHPAILSLYTFYSRSAFVVLLLYSCLLVVIWQSPYGLQSYMLIWPSILAFYPLAMFTWSFLKIHKLMYRIKQSNVDMINRQVKETLELLSEQASRENAEILAQLMDIQKKVEAVRDWPIAFQGIVTFVVGMIAPIAQVLISVFDVFK